MKRYIVLLATTLSLIGIFLHGAVYPQLPTVRQSSEKEVGAPTKVVLKYWEYATVPQENMSEGLDKINSLMTTTPGDFKMIGDICHPTQYPSKPDDSKDRQFFVILTGRRGVDNFMVTRNEGLAWTFYSKIRSQKLRFVKILEKKEEEDEAAIRVEYANAETEGDIYFLLTKKKKGWKIFSISSDYDFENKYFAEKITCLGEDVENNNSPARVVKEFWDLSSSKQSQNKEDIEDLLIPTGLNQLPAEDNSLLSSVKLKNGRLLLKSFLKNISRYKFDELFEGQIKDNRGSVRLSYLKNNKKIPDDIRFLLYKLDGQWKIFSITTDPYVEKKYLGVSN